MKYINRFFLIIILIISLFLIGCSPNSNAKAKNANIIKDVKSQLENEKQVKTSDIKINDNKINLNIKTKNNIEEDEAKKIANKYCNILKNNYKNNEVTVNINRPNDNKPITEQIPIKNDQLAAQVKSFVNVEYIDINIRDIDPKTIKKVIMDDKELPTKAYDISNGELSIINSNKNSKIKIITSSKKYDVVFLN